MLALHDQAANTMAHIRKAVARLYPRAATKKSEIKGLYSKAENSRTRIISRFVIVLQRRYAAAIYATAPVSAGALTVSCDKPNADVNTRINREFKTWLFGDGYQQYAGEERPTKR